VIPPVFELTPPVGVPPLLGPEPPVLGAPPVPFGCSVELQEMLDAAPSSTKKAVASLLTVLMDLSLSQPFSATNTVLAARPADQANSRAKPERRALMDTPNVWLDQYREASRLAQRGRSYGDVRIDAT
jgi:hypothetical protein